MYRVGLSNSGHVLSEEYFAGMQKAGILDLEISMKFADYPDLDHKAIEKMAKQYGVNLWSYHMPFAGNGVFDIASLDEDLRKYTVKTLCEYIKKGTDIGIDKFVQHPCGEPVSEEKNERAEQMKRAMESLNCLAETAAEGGAVVAVEDLPRSCLGRNAEEILELISVNDKLRVCFDTNHMLIEDNLRFVEMVGDKIVTLHVSDYDFVNERHWLPGEGKNDWPALYRKIKESGYNGVWMYEIGFGCPDTIRRDRDLCFADFARNAEEIFTGKPLTVLGTPKKNLGMWGEAIDHDLHIHSQLSLCSNDPEQTTQRLLQYAKENGYSTICLTDHFWDETVEGASDWYAKQDWAHIKKALPLPQDEGVNFLFGVETELNKDLTVGVSKERMEDLDFIIIPTTHFHMNNYTITEEDAASPENRAKAWVRRLDALLHMDLPFYKIGIAHLACGLIAPTREEFIATLKAIPTEEMERLFTRAAQVQVGIELNSDDMDKMLTDAERGEEIRRMFRTAKRCGCKFYFGSDAHHPQSLDRAKAIFEKAVVMLELEESDKIGFLKTVG